MDYLNQEDIVNKMLEKYNFNKASGYLSLIFISIAISLLVFSLVYMSEGIGWISAYDDDPNDLYLDVGWNWVRGSGVAFLVAVVLIVISFILLGKNKINNIKYSNKLKTSSQNKFSSKSDYLFGKLDLNNKKSFTGLVLLSVALVFLFNGILYRIESTNWLYGGIYNAQGWFFEEASAWATSSYYMFLITILLATIGSLLLVIQYKSD